MANIVKFSGSNIEDQAQKIKRFFLVKVALISKQGCEYQIMSSSLLW